MLVEDFDYPLPKELIAQKPLYKRDSSRLMVVRGRERFHTHFKRLADHLERGDLLVVNNSKVVPARLEGRKSTGGRVEALLLQQKGYHWECLLRGRVREGARLFFGEIEGEVVERKEEKALLRFKSNGNFREVLDRIGKPPTPPYIKREVNMEEYQTLYARHEGSVAAPTAGFHFTAGLVKELKSRGIGMAEVTLHVGQGTFQTPKSNVVEEHTMHRESFFIEPREAEKISLALEEGRGVIPVGTTSLRALESSAREGRVTPGDSSTELFIYPGYEFLLPYKGLITNFHLPRSTLLMLVCAFAGRETIFSSYKEAIARRYRFFSFGDAMLILR